MRNTISCLVQNRPGVLAAIAKYLSERNINIHSIADTESDGEQISRITVVIDNDDDDPQDLQGIAGQLSTIENVVEVEELDRTGFLERELVLILMKAETKRMPELMQILEVMQASVAAMGEETITVEMTGTEKKISSLLRLLGPFRIKEYARSGLAAIREGE
ncbi:MAG: acetolactate synthase small subunit [Spirochaetes bacterium]|nr:acetolactate synthase small subunit [Spirochaetota bacterium]